MCVSAADLSQFECFQRVFRALNGDAIEETVVTKVHGGVYASVYVRVYASVYACVYVCDHVY